MRIPRYSYSRDRPNHPYAPLPLATIGYLESCLKAPDPEITDYSDCMWFRALKSRQSGQGVTQDVGEMLQPLLRTAKHTTTKGSSRPSQDQDQFSGSNGDPLFAPNTVPGIRQFSVLSACRAL